MSIAPYITLLDKIGNYVEKDNAKRRSISGNEEELFEQVSAVCNLYLGEKGQLNGDITLLLDGNLIWVFEAFINRQILSIKSEKDTGHLLDGLVALAIIGDVSDLKDIGLWALELYTAAKIHKIREADRYFDAISAISSNQMRDGSNGVSSIAREIGKCPSETKKWVRKPWE
jgi:hypothetical protein